MRATRAGDCHAERLSTLRRGAGESRLIALAHDAGSSSTRSTPTTTTTSVTKSFPHMRPNMARTVYRILGRRLVTGNSLHGCRGSEMDDSEASGFDLDKKLWHCRRR